MINLKRVYLAAATDYVRTCYTASESGTMHSPLDTAGRGLADCHHPSVAVHILALCEGFARRRAAAGYRDAIRASGDGGKARIAAEP
jgi:hypothetical protein